MGKMFSLFQVQYDSWHNKIEKKNNEILNYIYM